MISDEIFEQNLRHFQVMHKYEGKAQCKCPAHSDNKASLTVTRGNKCTLFHCHAGCSLDDILAAAGIEKKDTFYQESVKQENWKTYIEKREKRRIEQVYEYRSIDTEKYAFSKIRLEGKKMLYGILKNNRFSYGLPRNTPRKSLKAVYGDLQDIKDAIKNNMPVFIPEGEKDVNTLKKRGYAAFTYGSANDWQDGLSEIVRDAKVYVLADNDKPGREVAERIVFDLQGIAKESKIIIPCPEEAHADITNFFESGKTNEEFEQLLAEKQEETLQKPVSDNANEESDRQQDVIFNALVSINAAKNFETNDKGFGALYAEVFRNKHRYNPSRKDFMLYDGKRWIDDVEGLAARADAKILSDSLLKYAVSNFVTEADRSSYLKHITALCNIRNRNNMLQDSKDVYFFSNEELDKNDYLLNVQNGTVDLSEGKPRFIEHDPDLLLSKICNANYNPAATCKEWDKFLLEIMQGDKEKIRYLQKIAGLSLTGNTEQETCFILYGSTTRNGKSTFCETIIHLLGDYALTMKPESLAVKQNLDSRQASGDIARLAGCRFCNASEPPKRMLFDTALLKSLLGRDSITARHLHQREFSFIPKFKLVINTNYLPTITDDTVFSSGRINVVSFDRHFKPEEQDKHLKDKLRNEKEMSGILNWAIEGLQLYRLEGLTPPEAVTKSTDAYRNDSDKIGNFINECLVKTGQNSKAKDVYEIYTEWCSDNGYGVENKGNFFSELKGKRIFATSATVDGKTVKNAVIGYSIESDFTEITDQTVLPFQQ